MQRRNFLKIAGAAASLQTLPRAVAQSPCSVAVLLDPTLTAQPVLWARQRLLDALAAGGATIVPALEHSAEPPHIAILIAPPASSLATASFPTDATALTPDSFRLVPGHIAGAPALLLTAADPRGFVYGLLELADRVRRNPDPADALSVAGAVTEHSPNAVRSIQRSFLSEVEDKPWFYDRAFWTAYLDSLATARFNRFNLAFGFGYDFPKGVTGDYFHFPYPYLVEVPGYDVQIHPALAPGERGRNLETLQFVAAETARRGLSFQLGIWTHAFQWTDSPNSDHTITGLTPATHAAYCRDALALILKACPQISGLTLRIHGESGIPEGSYDFWRTVFTAIPAAGRTIEIDMHAKGINQTMIDMARQTGMPVKVSAKYAAEHMSLSYHQADIRELEIPRSDRMETGVFAVSNGERRFTRYGYADLYQQGSGYEVLYRLWPGTQHHLLWGDPALAAGYGRTANFCGAAGLEICEPLTFKGREGSGHPGGRNAYANAAFESDSGGKDTGKFAYTYAVWGRLLFNPDSQPDSWRALLRKDLGPLAPSLETALANSSRILPLITSAYLPSGSNHTYWPEMYTTMPVVTGSDPAPYSDSPKPYGVATVSPLDPQLFSSGADHAKDLLTGVISPRYSPIEVAQWLDRFVNTSNQALAQARRTAGDRDHLAAFRRMEEDIAILNGLGSYFADLLRAGVLYSLFEQTGDPTIGQAALARYTAARTTWAGFADRARPVYVQDVSYGHLPHRRGHWADRLPAMDRDLQTLRTRVAQKVPPMVTAAPSATVVAAAFRSVTNPSPRPANACRHTAPQTFHPGAALPLSVTLAASTGTEIHLCYRHVNQGERWRSVPMNPQSGAFQAAIPAAYTDSPFPLQYYFELRSRTSAWFFPAFNDSLSNQPYYAVFRRA